jgi:uncharacterized damage-inducible protein DinB
MEPTIFTDTGASRHSPKQHFLSVFDHEHATTLRILRAFPEDRLDLKPAEKSNTASALLNTFVLEMWLAERALTTGFDWSAPPPGQPKAPTSVEAFAQALDERQKRVAALVRDASDDALSGTVQFPVRPKTMGDIPKIDFLWGMVFDQVHHRGQLSVYLRLAGAKVPSIYGPTADEPWF